MKGIMFSSGLLPLVRSGVKTMTRRVMKPQPRITDAGLWYGAKAFLRDSGGTVWNDADLMRAMCMFARYKPGETVYVKEGWRVNDWNEYSGTMAVEYDDGTVGQMFLVQDEGRFNDLWVESSNDCRAAGIDSNVDGVFEWDGRSPCRRRSPLFMPEWAARTRLLIEDVRVERVQEITEEDIKREGVDLFLVDEVAWKRAKRYRTEPEYWVHGDCSDGSRYDTCGESFCYKCCEKQVAELQRDDPGGTYSIDGGWGSEGDSRPFCETCGVPLEYDPTQYAVEEIVSGLQAEGLVCPEDYADLILATQGSRDYKIAEDTLLRLGWGMLWDSINAKPKPVRKKGKIVAYESYPWASGNETREHRGLPWYVWGNPYVWAYRFGVVRAVEPFCRGRQNDRKGGA